MDAQSGRVDRPQHGPAFSWAALTHSGLRRSTNEDSYRVRPDLTLFVVADGMGGHVAGEVASRVTVDALEAFVGQTADLTRDDTWPFAIDPAISLAANRLKAGIAVANRRLADEQAHDPSLKGMATTVSAVLFDTGAAIAHVGDSRVYVYRRQALERLTADHSWVEEQVRSGSLSASDARRHPWRNVVTRALSGGLEPDVDTREERLDPGDRVLLCTDGLSGVVPDAAIAHQLSRRDSPERLCADLVDDAINAGGPDNVTVVLIDINAP